MIENNGSMPLQLDWLLGRNSVSKLAVLLTEWVFEGDLVSKMADLLTEKGAECGRATLTAKRWPSGFEGATTFGRDNHRSSRVLPSLRRD